MSLDITPVVGMGATLYHHSDRSPATIVEVITERLIVIQEDSYERIDLNGMSDSQQYIYSADPNGLKHTVSLRKDGVWRVRKGRTVISIGSRRKYHDFSF